jgi:hypothetical protein
VGSVEEEESRSRESGRERESAAAKQGKGTTFALIDLPTEFASRRNNFSKSYWPTALKFFVS